MDQMLAYCGLVCHTCPIYLAARQTDPIEKHLMRVEIATKCSQYFGKEYKAEDITDCDGCRAGTGRLFSACTTCRIRSCAAGKNVDSCGRCPRYPCPDLDDVFAMDPDAQERLDQIRRIR